MDCSKCEKFINNTDNHFKTTKIMNFDIIHRQCGGEKVPEELYKYYETIREKEVSQYSKSNPKKIYSSAIKVDHKDLYLKRESILKYFKTLTY